MSHFTIMIKIPSNEIGEDEIERVVAKKLAPYQENNMGDCPREFLKFNDVEEESRQEWETGGTEMVRLPDGKMVYAWDDMFRVGSNVLDSTHKLPPHLKEEFVSFKERYPTFEGFMREYHGHKARDPETGKYGYWENPNRKWDWYQIGGRWQGKLLLKDKNVKKIKGEAGLMTPCNDDPYTADAARFGDIDWEGMSALVDGEIEDFYRDVETIRNLTAKKDAGKKLSKNEEKELSLLEFDIRWRIFDLGLVNKDAEGKYISMKDFTLEDLKRDHRHEWEFRTFAAITEDGKWCEKGEMGWFGCHSGTEEDCLTWSKGFKKNLLEGTAPDTWIVIVDCHI